MVGAEVSPTFQKVMLPLRWLVTNCWPLECQHTDCSSPISSVCEGGRGGGGRERREGGIGEEGRKGREGGKGREREGGREGRREYQSQLNVLYLCRTSINNSATSCVQSYSCYLHGPKDGEWFPGKSIPQF